jgi:hypothetical protein
MEYTVFLVDRTPYGVVEWDLKEKNLEFLNGIDPDYFHYVAKSHLASLDGEDKNRAAVAIRLGFFHGMETLFSIICATLQAPDCYPAWIEKCTSGQLRSMVDTINRGSNHFQNKLNIDWVDWDSMAEKVFFCSKFNEKIPNETIKKFSQFWSRLSSIYLNENYKYEFNSIKHGFRTKAGGFHLRMGVEPEYGVSPPEEEMRHMGGSKFGTSFYRAESLNLVDNKLEKHNLRIKQHNINWNPETMCYSLGLICTSLQNIISFAKIINGIDPKTVKFSRPQDLSCFDKPWDDSVGVFSMSMNPKIQTEGLNLLSRQEILEKLKFKA